MQQASPILMDEAGIRITAEQMTTPAGSFPVEDIRRREKRIRKPLWGPVLLALVGTLNLAVGLETGFWLDLMVASLLLSCGLLWRIRGTRYLLVVQTSAGEIEAWSAPGEAQLEKALDILNSLAEQQG